MSANDKLVIARQPRAILTNIILVSHILMLFGSRYSRMDQVKFVEGSL